MFGLGQQVGCHIARIRCLVSDDENLARSGDGINAHIAVNSFLCQGHKNISRSDDFIHFRNRFCPEGQSCHGLGSADFINDIGAGFMGSDKCSRIYFSVFSRRCHHHNLFHAGNLCRKDIHQYRGWIGGFSTGHIDTDPG